MRLAIATITLAITPHVLSAPLTAGDEMGVFLAHRGLTGAAQSLASPPANTVTDMVSHAIGFLGVPYRLGGDEFESGYDCSGFVRAVVERTLGLVLPRRAEQQAAATREIEPNRLAPGDLVFFNTLSRAFSHVGIYVGDGRFIHSPKPGAQVRVEDMRKSYWTQRFDGARRVQFASLEQPTSR